MVLCTVLMNGDRVLMFCTSFPKYHPLSLKRAWENLEEIVLKDNRTLLYQLYERV